MSTNLTTYSIEDNIQIMTIYLSPSDLAFLYEQSKWGFYNKYKNGIKRPNFTMPKIFNIIDSLIKEKYLNQNLSTIDSNLPDAIVTSANNWVVSREICNESYPDLKVQIRGIIDGVFEYPDKSYAIVDFKTSEINPEYLDKYKLQLNAYSYSVTYPENSKKFSLPALKNTGLLVFQPDNFEVQDNKANLSGQFKWVEFDLDLDGFESFVKEEIIPLLCGKEPTPDKSDPQWEYLLQFGFSFEEE